MDEFRGVKLVHKEVDQNLSVGIKVDFDKTKHLSEVSIKRRKIVRDRLIAKEKTKEEDERKRLKMEEDKQEQERFGMLFIFLFVMVHPSYLNTALLLYSCIIYYQNVNHFP